MSFQNWLSYLRSAEKHSMISGKIRKVFYKFPDGKQMAEEYSMDTGVIQRRAWRKCKQIMDEPDWETELGETPYKMGAGIGDADKMNIGAFTVKESNTEPILTKRITKKNIEWRIRNLPFPIDVYKVQAITEKRCITIRTTNKKYFKVIEIQELVRCNQNADQANLSLHHQFNTLVITYKKPDIVCEMDAAVLLLLKEVETETDMEELLSELMTN